MESSTIEFEEVSSQEFESHVSTVDQTWLDPSRTYSNKKCYMSTDKMAGYCLVGDCVYHVFSKGRGLAPAILADLIKRGGTWGMSFDGPLVSLYLKLGLDRVYECPAESLGYQRGRVVVFMAMKNSAVRSRPEVISWMAQHGQ
jgi:hypothetical protein